MIQPETTQKALKAEIKNEVLQELRRVEMKPTGGGAPTKGNQDGKKDQPKYHLQQMQRERAYC